ncbi:MAG: exosome complex component Rrp42 [Desulfurococcales archaeon ex4484_42]|nr:MAG: exosome complex component Rrp42 [Desulfurococcales archaeon ex4484_42]
MSVTPTSPEYILPRIKVETLASLVRKGIRLSGRGLEDYRDISIELNYIPNAEGSALVRLGNTQVLVGIKLEVGTPYPDTPNEGTMVVSAEFVPTASPVFEPGPPDENAIELARVIDRSIRELKAIDLSKLVLIPGKKVWNVWIDIYVLDHDGNLIDASSIASLAALMVTKIPKAEVTQEGEVKVDKSTYVGPLPMNHKVVTVTVGKLRDVLLADPDLEEESVLDTKLVIAVSDDGRVAGIQKTGMGYLTKDEVLRIVDIALRKGKEIIAKVNEAVSKHKVKIEEESKEAKEEEGKEGS